MKEKRNACIESFGINIRKYNGQVSKVKSLVTTRPTHPEVNGAAATTPTAQLPHNAQVHLSAVIPHCRICFRVGCLSARP